MARTLQSSSLSRRRRLGTEPRHLLTLLASLALLLCAAGALHAQEPGSDDDDDWLQEAAPDADASPGRDEVITYLRGLSAPELEALLGELQPQRLDEREQVARDAELHAALEALARGRLEEAQAGLQRFTELYPDDPRAPLAAELATAVSTLDDAQRVARANNTASSTASRGTSVADQLRDEGSTAAAIELVFTLTTYGIWSGVALGLAADMNSEYLVLVSALTGLGALGGGLFYAWDRPIDSAQSGLVTNGLLYGSWNGLAIALMAEADSTTAFVLTWAGSTLGVGTGLLLGNVLEDLDDGDIALANSGGLWGTFVAGMLLAVAAPDGLDTTTVFGVLLAGTDLGLTAMSIASHWIDTSRGRQTLIDLGGLLGAMLGGGILFAADIDDPTAFGLSMLASAGLGITAAALLTSLLDDDDPAPVARHDPPSHLQLALPSPILVPTADPDHPAAGIGLLQGTW